MEHKATSRLNGIRGLIEDLNVQLLKLSNPITGLNKPKGFRNLRPPDFKTNGT
jgi:hypothetical protein